MKNVFLKLKKNLKFMSSNHYVKKKQLTKIYIEKLSVFKKSVNA